MKKEYATRRTKNKRNQHMNNKMTSEIRKSLIQTNNISTMTLKTSYPNIKRYITEKKKFMKLQYFINFCFKVLQTKLLINDVDQSIGLLEKVD